MLTEIRIASRLCCAVLCLIFSALLIVGCATTPPPTSVPAPTSTPSPTPAGFALKGRIAFYCPEARGIRIYSADGSNVSDRLTAGWSCDPDWSPDGKKIAFVIGSNKDGYNIYTMNTDGTGVMQLTHDNYVSDHPDWSPDGKRIIFVCGTFFSGGQLVTINADGSNRSVLYAPFMYKTPDGIAFDPAWSPNGKYVAFAARCIEDNSKNIYLLSTDIPNVTRLTYGPANDSNPAWSPDGKYIAFVSDRDRGKNKLYVMNADGSNVKQIQTDLDGIEDIYFPTWSPDGRYIAFSTRGNLLYVINADGSGLKFIRKGYHPSWAP